eukprot:TRINITY_DN11423_c1_g1_i1.p1 TRINITY_DN11423_c1_g1~~TRINITY_DN11423_c1_g1_i1.p1  ORF type:complete len:193 (+),score=23.38 TRINITY_DN11423_c1_g1_i1:108-686(+)
MLVFVFSPRVDLLQSTPFTLALLPSDLLAQQRLLLPGAAKTLKLRRRRCNIATFGSFMRQRDSGQRHLQASDCSALTANAMSVDYGGEPVPGFSLDSLVSAAIAIGLAAAYLSFAAGKGRANGAGRAVVEARDRLDDAIAESSTGASDTSNSEVIELRRRELAAAKERFQKDRRWRFGPLDIELNPAVDQQV